MNKQLLTGLALLAVTSLTGISFAQSTGTAAVSVTAAGVSGSFATVSATNPISGDTAAANAAPAWSPSVGAVGAVTAGDVYYIDVGTYTGDIVVTLYLNNPDKLMKNYSYLNLAVAAYGATNSGGTWAWNASPIASFKTSDQFNTYLTLTNGYVSFILRKSGTTQASDGHSYFAVTVEGGSFYCKNNDTTNGSLSPQFFVDVRQA